MSSIREDYIWIPTNTIQLEMPRCILELKEESESFFICEMGIIMVTDFVGDLRT